MALTSFGKQKIEIKIVELCRWFFYVLLIAIGLINKHFFCHGEKKDFFRFSELFIL